MAAKPSTPIPVYVTHDELPWDEVHDADRVVQLRVGDHVVLEVPFRSSDREYDSDEAARVIADKLREILNR